MSKTYSYYYRDDFTEDLQELVSLDLSQSNMQVDTTVSAYIIDGNEVKAYTVVSNEIHSSTVSASNATMIGMKASNIETSNVIATGVINSSSIHNKDLVETNTLSAQTITGSNVTADIGDFDDIKLSNHSILSDKPTDIYPNGAIDFSWLTEDPLSNVVWTDKWGQIGGTAGGAAGGALAATLAAGIYSAPFLSPSGTAAFDTADAIAGFTATDNAYALGVEVGREWGVYVAGLEGGNHARSAGVTAVETSITTTNTGGNEIEASAIGALAGTAAVQLVLVIWSCSRNIFS